MTSPTEEAFEWTAFTDPKNVVWVPVSPVSEDNPYDEGPLDSDGLTDAEFDMIFRRPAIDVPGTLLASAWNTTVETDTAVANAARETLQSRMDPDLKRYWLSGEGAAKIRWGTPGAFKRCVSNLREHFPQATEGLCANLYHEATGHWPGEDRGKK